jgi:methionyl aminopeptidase
MFKQPTVRRKTPEQIARMRTAGRVVAEMHEKIREAVRPGVTTAELDVIGRDVIERRGAVSNFLGYNGTYPAVICASPNDMIVHGIPGAYRLEEGDIISVDCGAIVDGWHGDAAFTAGVGRISPEAQRLIDVTEASLLAGIGQMVPGHRIGDIGHAVQQVAEAAGFSVVREYVGHAIGTAMHEEPQVPNYGPAGRGERLKAGNVFAVEPMVNAGSPDTEMLEDGWSVVTADGSLSAHWEHTVAITDDGPQILTLP